VKAGTTEPSVMSLSSQSVRRMKRGRTTLPSLLFPLTFSVTSLLLLRLTQQHSPWNQKTKYHLPSNSRSLPPPHFLSLDFTSSSSPFAFPSSATPSQRWQASANSEHRSMYQLHPLLPFRPPSSPPSNLSTRPSSVLPAPVYSSNRSLLAQRSSISPVLPYVLFLYSSFPNE
jgi:hypothetical protein